MQPSDWALIDLRPASIFANGFLPGSVNLPDLQGWSEAALKEFVGQRTVCFLADSQEAVDDAASDISALGQYRVGGWHGSEVLREWREAHETLGSIEEIEPDTLAVRLAAWKTVLVDIRPVRSFESTHIPEALSIPLPCLTSSLSGLPVQTRLSILCHSGHKSSFAASLLWNLNYRNISFVRGGLQNCIERGLPAMRSQETSLAGQQ